MTLANLSLDQSTFAQPLDVTRQTQSGLISATTCGPHLIQLVKRIELAEVRDIVGTVFADLLRLLECLTFIENHLRQVDAAEETFALFQVIHDEARVLVNFIREDGLNCAAMDDDLVDTLDGITFAVNHDLQRVFETAPRATSESSNLEPQSPSAHVVVGKLYRAHDVLTNCLQQSTITLAMMFDPELDGATLFNISDLRYRQSRQLCHDLSALMQLVEAAENETVEAALSSLTAGIEEFRHESMESLMYSDWPQFESFCDRIKLGTRAPDLQSVLHQFCCYLETLLGQVRMRAVLVNASPTQFGASGTAEWPAPDGDASAQLSPPFDPPEQEANWNTLAVA